MKLGPVGPKVRGVRWGEGEVGGIPRNVQAGEWVQWVVGVRERREGGTCAGCQAALTWIIVALRSLAFTLSFPTLIAR